MFTSHPKYPLYTYLNKKFGEGKCHSVSLWYRVCFRAWLLKLCSVVQQPPHCLGACQRCRSSGPSPDNQTQNLNFIKIPRKWMIALQCEKHQFRVNLLSGQIILGFDAHLLEALYTFASRKHPSFRHLQQPFMDSLGDCWVEYK